MTMPKQTNRLRNMHDDFQSNKNTTAEIETLSTARETSKNRSWYSPTLTATSKTYEGDVKHRDAALQWYLWCNGASWFATTNQLLRWNWLCMDACTASYIALFIRHERNRRWRGHLSIVRLLSFYDFQIFTRERLGERAVPLTSCFSQTFWWNWANISRISQLRWSPFFFSRIDSTRNNFLVPSRRDCDFPSFSFFSNFFFNFITLQFHLLSKRGTIIIVGVSFFSRYF